MFDKVEAYHRPATVREAVRLLHNGKGRARVVAGGTDVAAAGDRSVRALIDITGAGLRYIRRRGTAFVIGAASTMADIEESPLMRALAGGLLAQAAATCGSVQIRNMATVGGNLANGSPAADLATPLLALEAVVVAADSRGRHRITLAEYLAHGRKSGPLDSLLVEVVIPEPPCSGRCGWSFQKQGRTKVDISLVNVAAGLELDARGRVKWARIALGAAGPAPLRAPAVEQLMAGRTLDRTLLAEAGGEVMRAVRPITDVRASAAYRRELSRVLTVRALEACAVQTGCSL
jgi:carbon-monoxide dehydrogenase medium subunit